MFWTSSTTAHWYISNNSDSLTEYGASLKTGMSVRCLRDATEYELSIYIDGDSLGDVFDVDGNRYDTTLIGTQVWLTSNLKTTRYNNGAAIPRVDDPTTWGSFLTGMYCIYNNGELSDYQEITLTDKLKPKNDLSVSAKHINGLGNYINEATKSALRCTPQMVTKIFDGNALTEVSVTHNLNTLSLVGTIYDISGKSMKIDPPYCYFRPDTVNTVMVVTNDTTVHAISLIGVNDDCDSDYGAFCLGCENI